MNKGQPQIDADKRGGLAAEERRRRRQPLMDAEGTKASRRWRPMNDGMPRMDTDEQDKPRG